MVSQVVDFGLRGLEFFWTLLIMALVGNAIAGNAGGSPSIINYSMFVAVISMVSLIYLFVVAWNKDFAGHRLVPIVVDTLNTLFFFCGAVALAAELGVHSCSNRGYTSSNRVLRGLGNQHKRCQEMQAVDAFLWFGFACYLVSMIFSVFENRGGVNLSGIRKGGPAMSQV